MRFGYGTTFKRVTVTVSQYDHGLLIREKGNGALGKKTSESEIVNNVCCNILIFWKWAFRRIDFITLLPVAAF